MPIARLCACGSRRLARFGDLEAAPYQSSQCALQRVEIVDELREKLELAHAHAARRRRPGRRRAYARARPRRSAPSRANVGDAAPRARATSLVSQRLPPRPRAARAAAPENASGSCVSVSAKRVDAVQLAAGSARARPDPCSARYASLTRADDCSATRFSASAAAGETIGMHLGLQLAVGALERGRVEAEARRQTEQLEVVARRSRSSA